MSSRGPWSSWWLETEISLSSVTYSCTGPHAMNDSEADVKNDRDVALTHEMTWTTPRAK